MIKDLLVFHGYDTPISLSLYDNLHNYSGLWGNIVSEQG